MNRSSDNKIVSMLLKHKVVAIVRGLTEQEILPAAEAVYRGGIRLLEITFAQDAPVSVEQTSRAIRSVGEHFPDMGVGAGTVMTEEQLRAAHSAGAEFILSPNTDIKLIQLTKELGMVSVPGALTPTEITTAWLAGADFVKVFPAGVFGSSYIKAIRGPIRHIPLMAVGGIDIENLSDYLAAGACCAGIGSNLIDPRLASAGDYDRMTQLAAEFVRAAQEGQNP